ncbi:hypothetical protein BDF19DRAFT_430751 [Syncephalis fuscata]|nr:hypothetical protein BDF19DRAFT_430751 [Syncephalis fuscata]
MCSYAYYILACPCTYFYSHSFILSLSLRTSNTSYNIYILIISQILHVHHCIFSMYTEYLLLVAGFLAATPTAYASDMNELVREMQGNVNEPWHIGGDSNGRVFNQSWGNYEYFDGFFAMKSVKSTYIGLFCLWLLWIIARMLNSLFGKSARSTHAGANAPGTAGTNAAGETTAQQQQLIPLMTWLYTSATTRVEKLIRDLILLLLVPLVVNGFGRGSGVGTEILTWLFFAFALIFMLVEFVAGNRLFRSAFNLLLIGLSLTIFILAYAAGWHIP